MNILDHINISDFEQNFFPEELCVFEDEREENVFISSQKFICIIKTNGDDNYLGITICKPVIYKDEFGGVYHEWLDSVGNVYSAKENSFISYDDTVIAWKAVNG